jgi:Flp pilus assembly protein TadD
MGTLLRIKTSVILLSLLAGCAGLPPGSLSLTDSLLSEARQAIDAGDLATALVKLRQLQSMDARSGDVLRLSARLHEQLGDTASLQAVHLQILENNPQDVQSLVWLGLQALRSSKLNVAADYLQQALTLDPYQWQALNGLGVIADNESRSMDAQIYFQRGLALIPGHPKLTANLGWSKVLTGELEEAEKLLRDALRTAPDVLATRSNLAWCIALQGRYEHALDLYAELYGQATAFNNVGYAAALRGDTLIAQHYLQQAISSRPSFYTKAANNLARIAPARIQR